MAYLKAKDGEVEKFPYTLGMLRRDNPNTSFPSTLSPSMLASYDVYEVKVEAAPTVDEKNYKAVRANTPVEEVGQWVLKWSVVEKTPAEKQAHYDNAAGAVRTKRDGLLQQTDWMALSDTPPMPEAWASYRQALRDITDQAGFPYDVTWPEKPSS